MRLAGALWMFWFQRGYFREGIERLDHLLAIDDRPTAARARTLTGSGSLHTFALDLDTGQQRQEEALQIYFDLDDERGAAYARLALGIVANERRDYERSLTIFQESLDEFRRLGDDHGTLLGLQTVSFASLRMGETERAWELRRQIAPLARETGNPRMLGVGLRFEAMIARDEGRLDDAVALLDEAHQIHHDHADIREISWDLLEAANILEVVNHASEAAQVLSQSQFLRNDRGIAIGWMDEETSSLSDVLRSRLGDTAFQAAWERGRVLDYDEAFAVLLGQDP